MPQSSDPVSPFVGGDGGRHKREVPESVRKLGLALPVSEADVKQAYFAKARQAHPDRGGSTAEFVEVQRAFDEALQFAQRSGKRLPWIGAQLPIYLAQQAAVELVASWGGRTTVEALDWLEDTVGEDFAAMGDRLVTIDIRNLPVGDEELTRLGQEAESLPYLERLLLGGTRVTAAGLERLPRMANLQWLDLRGAPVAAAARREWLTRVERVEGATWIDRALVKLGRSAER